MAETFALPDFRWVRSREHHQLVTNVDHILDLEYIPAGAHVGKQSFRLKVFSLEPQYSIDSNGVTSGLAMQNFGVCMLSCIYMPFFESDAYTLPTDWKVARTMMNKRIDKVETAAPTQALTTVDAENAGGSTQDANLLYRPDRIHQSALETSQTTMPFNMLFKRIVRLGLFDDAAVRTGNLETVQYMTNFGGMVGTEFSTALPGIIIWVLTIPPGPEKSGSKAGGSGTTEDPYTQNDTDTGYKALRVKPGEDTEYSMTDTKEGEGGGRDYLPTVASYRFITPRRNPITGELEAVTDLDLVNNFRKMSLIRRGHYNFKGGTDPSPFFKQVSLNAVIERDIIFRRNAPVNNFVSAAGA